jgi:hypothetical protein
VDTALSGKDPVLGSLGGYPAVEEAATLLEFGFEVVWDAYSTTYGSE